MQASARAISRFHRVMRSDGKRDEGLCGPQTPAPKASGLWTPACGCGLTPTLLSVSRWNVPDTIIKQWPRSFRPGGLSRRPGCPKAPGGKHTKMPGEKRHFPPGIFVCFPWAGNTISLPLPKMFQAEACRLLRKRHIAGRGPGDGSPGAEAWGLRKPPKTPRNQNRTFTPFTVTLSSARIRM